MNEEYKRKNWKVNCITIKWTHYKCTAQSLWINYKVGFLLFLIGIKLNDYPINY